VQCPDCGYVMSDFDKACPRCENLRPQEPAKAPHHATAPSSVTPVRAAVPKSPIAQSLLRILALLGVCSVIVAIGVLIAVTLTPDRGAPSWTAPPEPSSTWTDLHGTVAFKDGLVMVRNDDAFPWNATVIVLNPDEHFDGYSVSVAGIPAGQGVSCGIANFAKADGTRFDPYVRKLLRVYIHARTPQGEGAYGGVLRQ
jgi:hypothetical protein